MTRATVFRWTGGVAAVFTVASAYLATTGSRRYADRRYAERTAASAAAYLAAVSTPRNAPLDPAAFLHALHFVEAEARVAHGFDHRPLSRAQLLAFPPQVFLKGRATGVPRTVIVEVPLEEPVSLRLARSLRVQTELEVLFVSPL